MAISLETAIKHYSYLDRRVAAKLPAITRNLQKLAARGFPAGEKLASIVHNAYLVQEHMNEFKQKDQASVRLGFDRALDGLFTQLSGLMIFPSWLENDLMIREQSFRRAVDMTVLKGKPFPSEARFDFDSFPDRILITSLAFINFCQLACSHCGGAGQWDDRSHSLDQLKGVRDKIRFPLNAPVTLTWHEPFSLPFLLDAVKYLLDEGTSVSLVSSLLGVPRERREQLLQGLQDLAGDGRVAINLSFDLFRKQNIDSYLPLIGDALNRFPIIKQLQFRYNHLNRANSLSALVRLHNEVSRPEAKAIIANLLEWEEQPPQLSTRIAYVGAAAAFDHDRAVSYLASKHERFGYLTEQRIAPYSQGFFLFPGGDIVPTCDWEAPQIRSLGNIFRNTPREIYRRYELFGLRYQMRRGQGFGAYDALLDTEVEMRGWHGIKAPLVDHYHNLVQIDAKRER